MMEHCEWDPENDALAVMACPQLHLPAQGCTNEATVSLGTGRKNIHLCESCAALPRFKRFRRRVGIGSARSSHE